MVPFVVEAEEASPRRDDAPPERGRHVVQRDEINGASAKRGSQLGCETKTHLEPVAWIGVHVVSKEHAHVHVALAMRSPNGLAPVEVGRDDPAKR
jgi:hypothetical protein